MRIAEVAGLSGLSADTIRFYEKEGLLEPIARDPSGHRRFSPRDVEWLELMSNLRRTGMAMADMRQFAQLVAEGEHTVPQRYELLAAHRETMKQRRAEIEACERILDHKLDVYGPMRDAMKKEASND